MGQDQLVYVGPEHLAALLLLGTEGLIASDGVQPSSETTGFLQLRQRLERQEESLLSHVLSAVRPYDAPGHCQHGRAEAHHQGVEGRQVAKEGRNGQLAIGKPFPRSLIHYLVAPCAF